MHDDGIPIRGHARRHNGVNRYFIGVMIVVGCAVLIGGTITFVVQRQKGESLVPPELDQASGVPLGPMNPLKHGQNWSLKQMKDFLLKEGHAVESEGVGDVVYLMRKKDGKVYRIKKANGPITADKELRLGLPGFGNPYRDDDDRPAVWGLFVFDPSDRGAVTDLEKYLPGVRYARYD